MTGATGLGFTRFAAADTARKASVPHEIANLSRRLYTLTGLQLLAYDTPFQGVQKFPKVTKSREVGLSSSGSQKKTTSRAILPVIIGSNKFTLLFHPKKEPEKSEHEHTRHANYLFREGLAFSANFAMKKG